MTTPESSQWGAPEMLLPVGLTLLIVGPVIDETRYFVQVLVGPILRPGTDASMRELATFNAQFFPPQIGVRVMRNGRLFVAPAFHELPDSVQSQILFVLAMRPKCTTYTMIAHKNPASA